MVRGVEQNPCACGLQGFYPYNIHTTHESFHPFEQAFNQALCLKRKSLYTINAKNQGRHLRVHYIPKGWANTSALYISKSKTDRKTQW